MTSKAQRSYTFAASVSLFLFEFNDAHLKETAGLLKI